MARSSRVAIPILLVLFLVSCGGDSDESDGAADSVAGAQQPVTKPETEPEATQQSDPLLSTFSTGPNDGYSWRRREIAYDNSVRTLSREHLVSTLWMIGRNDQWNSYLVFYLDDVVRAGWEQTGVAVEGTYEITGPDTVVLSLPADRDKDLSGRLLGPDSEVLLTFHKDPDGFWYRDFLAVEHTEIRWYALGSQPETGSIVQLEGRQLVSVHEAYVVLNNVKFRTQPSTLSETVPTNALSDLPLPVDIDFIPRGQQVTALARTIEVDNVGEWSNYWYYVAVPVYHSYELGWLYGEFIGPYDEEDAAVYREWNRAAWAEIRSR